jgi:multidrug resistance efflux pump
MLIKFGIPLVAALALGFGVATTMLLNPKEELVEPLNRPAVTTLAGPTVAGLGIVEPRSERVGIGSPLSGIVAEVHVVAGQTVKKGAGLVTLDTRDLRAELQMRCRTLELAEARLTRLRAGTRPEELPPARHRVAAALAVTEQCRDASARAERLLKSNAISVEETQSRRFALQNAEAELARVQAELARLEAGTWAYDIAVAEREVGQAKAAVDRVKVDLERSTVSAPMDGVVLQVNVRPGEYAMSGATSEPLIALGDRGPLRVRVQVDEDDALRIAPGQIAEGFVRGHGRERLELKFVRIEPSMIPKPSLSGSTTERVDTRVLIVLYEIVSSARPVYVGQQVDVFIRSAPENATVLHFAQRQPAGT